MGIWGLPFRSGGLQATGGLRRVRVMGIGREEMADEDMQYQIRRVSFSLSVYLLPSTKIHSLRNAKNLS